VTLEQRKACELFLLALTVWREARGESEEAQAAVAHSILTRANHPSWWGNDIVSVITKRWQYSSITDPRDPQLTNWPHLADPSWEKAISIAEGVLSGTIPNPSPEADSYYDTSIPPPYWTKTSQQIAKIGRLCFYKTRISA